MFSFLFVCFFFLILILSVCLLAGILRLIMSVCQIPYLYPSIKSKIKHFSIEIKLFQRIFQNYIFQEITFQLCYWVIRSFDSKNSSRLQTFSQPMQCCQLHCFYRTSTWINIYSIWELLDWTIGFFSFYPIAGKTLPSSCRKHYTFETMNTIFWDSSFGKVSH